MNPSLPRARASAAPPSPFAAALRVLFACCAALALPLAAFAQAATGSIIGRVFNPATGEYIRNAEIRVEGTQLSALSEDAGFYRIANVPAGTVSIVATYPGHDSAKTTANVTAGETATRDFELKAIGATPAATTSPNGTVQLQAFVVATEREGNAKAIAEQRASQNVKTVIASDSFGDIAEGNVGEFLKFMPGITLDYVETDTRAARMGGLEARYGMVTIDGNAIANASTGGFGDDTRQFEFEQISISNIETIEVNKTLSADLPADAPSGSINLRSKSALDQKGRRVSYSLSMIGNQYEHSLSKTPRHDDDKHAKTRPSFEFRYSEPLFNNKLGVTVTTQHSNVFKEQYRHALNYNYTSAQAVQIGRPLILGINYKDGPKMTEKTSGSLNLDYQPFGKDLTFTLRSSYTYFNDEIANRNANAVVSAGDIDLTQYSLTKVVARQTANANTRIEHTGSHGDKKGDTTSAALGFLLRKREWTIDGTASYSRARQQNGAEHMGTVDTANARLTRIGWMAERASIDSPDWYFTQTSGIGYTPGTTPQWFDLNNYNRSDALTNNVTLTRARAKTQQYVAQLNARKVMKWTLPTFFKTGLYTQLSVRDREQLRRDTFTFVGANNNQLTAGLPVSIATFDPVAFHGNGLFPLPVPDKAQIRGLLENNPNQFTRTQAQAASDLDTVLGSNQDTEEKIESAYFQGNTRIGKWTLQAGVRYEQTSTKNAVIVQNENNPFSVLSPTAANPTRRVAPNPLTLDYVNAKYATGREYRKADYDSVLFSGSARYNISRDFVARFGYHEAIKRPALGRIAGGWSIDDTNLEITLPNPNLDPEQSKKYSANFEYYFEPAGNVSLHVFQTEISNQSLETEFRPASEFGFEDLPVYSAYEFNTYENFPGKRKIRGIELSYGQQLNFFRHEALRGIGIFATYSHFWSLPDRTNFVPQNATAGLNYRYRKFNARIGGTWTDDIRVANPLTSAVGRGDTEWLHERFIFDVGFGYKLHRRAEFFVSGRNAFNSGKTWYFKQGDGRIRQMEKYGGQWTVGMKGTF